MDASFATTRFVVGLGNPGRRYAKTRHNVGWMVLEELGRRWGVSVGRSMCGGMVYDARPVGSDGAIRRVQLFEPHTYMNRSGEAVKGLLNFYKAETADLLVILDDLALETGVIRARQQGSAGGHNGLNNIIALLGTQDVARLRVGIGSPPDQMDSADYVLAPFSAEEMEKITPAVRKAADAVEDWMSHDMLYVMERYNRKAEHEPENSAGKPEKKAT